MSVMLGVALIGTLFYGLVNSHYLGLVISKTLGPYSDTLADVVLSKHDPELWQKIAARHGVTMLIEPADGDPVAFNDLGEPLSPTSPLLRDSKIRSVRSSSDGTRVTFFWAPWSFQESHLPLLTGLVIMVVAVVGSGFWFLHRQLKPLAWLHTGVESVSKGDFKARVPVVRDDEIGQVAEAFNEMASRVGEMIDDRERLLADVSHELRSPIARMKVALEFMPDGEKRDSLDHDIREMENLIAVLLEREELRSRAGRLQGQDIDLNSIIGEVAAAFANREPGIAFEPVGEARIHADPALMKLLIQNLIDNALKFSRPDSQPVVVETKRQESQLVLRVVDDGIGIPVGSEERLFGPFVKVDRARGHGAGYGLGLNLCQWIVQLHGGSINLHRRESGGTEAVVIMNRRGAVDKTSILPARRS